ncbi:epoxide hydrolase family protein [uncultured Jatrophihabitans sp.]|uniref:epoxide hydrolase family protein n=1 Tax=uncultured Jatrophihabitans sp. TaxID=1610747 RepID=UPI0035CA9913
MTRRPDPAARDGNRPVPAGLDITEFRVDVPESELEQLRRRLAETRWPDELADVGWDYGVPVTYLQELAEYWRTHYDWRAAEAAFNALPQFRTELDGADVYFVHLRSPHPGALPLILTHGWPGSVLEFTGIAAELADPTLVGGDPGDAFHVVVPSLPGYGFSGPTRDRGWTPPRVADAWHALMRGLGYASFVAYGGDWGSRVTRSLALRHPDDVLGICVTEPAGGVARGAPDAAPPDGERWRASAQRAQHFDREESAYGALQGTKPQTLSYALTDSPLGQLAWIVEKFHGWTAARRSPDEAVPRDLLLTNVMLYWLTGTAGSSARLYYETMHSPDGWAQRGYCTVPTAVAVFGEDTSLPVRSRAERYSNIVRWTEFARGGHFPGLEQPGVLGDELRAAFSSLR